MTSNVSSRPAEAETSEETDAETEVVGTHVPRLDGTSKVRGTVEYTDDVDFDGYYVEVVRSNVAHGTISSIETEAAEERPGVRAVVTGADLEAADWISPYVGPAFRDQPVLATEKVRYVGEPVAAIVAETPEAAEVAAGDVLVRCDRLDAVTNVTDARRDDAPLIHEDPEPSAVFTDLSGVKESEERNVAYTYRLEEGDLGAGFERADVVLEGTYSTPMIQHVHLEPFVTIADYDASSESLEVTTGNQTPHFVKRELARIFDLPSSHVTVEVTSMGGSYGGKTYVRTEPLVAALARVVEAPVKLRQSASESFDTAVRDGTETTVRTGVTADGDIVAQEVSVVWDSGAFADISPRKAKKAGYTAVGAYEIDAVSVTSKATYTNKPPGVAYRGFGVAQTAWAVESHLDAVAEEIGADPYEMRRQNAVRNEETYNGSPVGVTGVPECLDAVGEESSWLETEPEQPDAENLVRGRGMAVTLKTTITPSTAEAIVLLDADGSLTVVTGATEIGQGVQTTLAQIAAEELGIDVDRISVADPDTTSAPFNTSTTSSRTTYHVGNAVVDAIDDVKAQLVEFVAEGRDVDAASLSVEGGAVVGGRGVEYPIADVVRGHFVGGGGTVIGRGYYQSDAADSGDRYDSAFWMSGATVVEVTVDTRTGRYTVDRWVNAADAGKAIDPERVRGQILGAATQGLGHVRSEEMRFEDGQQVNKSLLDYKVPTIEDVPDDSTAIVVETNEPAGPHGAKGVGESNTITVPPAVGNAIADATGVRVRDLPVTPDKILAALEEEDHS